MFQISPAINGTNDLDIFSISYYPNPFRRLPPKKDFSYLSSMGRTLLALCTGILEERNGEAAVKARRSREHRRELIKVYRKIFQLLKSSANENHNWVAELPFTLALDPACWFCGVSLVCDLGGVIRQTVSCIRPSAVGYMPSKHWAPIIFGRGSLATR